MNEKKSSIIWNKYQSIWQELYQEYIYVFKDYKEYTLFVKNCLNQDNVKDKEKIDYYYNIVKKNIHNAIVHHLYNKKNNNLILKYINSKLDKNNDSLKEINKLIKWLKEYNYVPSPNTIINLIEKSEVFKELIQKLVENNLDKIKQYGVEKIFNNELISLFVEIYCSLNNIDFENDLKEDLNITEEEQVAINDILREQNIEASYEEYPEKRNDFLTNDYMPTGADAFLFEIRNKDLDVLTKEEERELLTKIKQGDQDAYKYFYEHNCRLVISIAKKYRNYRVDYEDLLQEGGIGLMVAISRFEIERNFKFSTYATWWIRQYVVRALSKYGRNIGIGINKSETLPLYQRKVDNYADELGRMPTNTEIAEHFNMTLAEVEENNQLLLPSISMNQRVNNVDETEFGDFIQDDNAQVEEDFVTNNLASEIQTLFQKAGLLPIEIAILNSSWGLNNQTQVSLSDLGKKYGFSRERARQYEAKAIKKLRRFSGMKDFALYLDNPKEAKENLNKLVDWHYSHPNSHIVYDINLSELDNCPPKKDIDTLLETLTDEKIMLSVYDLSISKDYNKNEIKTAIFMLAPEDKEIINLRYGSNLDKPVVSENWDFNKHGNKFYEIVIPHIVANLKLIRKQNEEIDAKIHTLSNESNIDTTLKSIYIKALKLTKLFEFKKMSQYFSFKEMEILAILTIKYCENINVEIEDFKEILELNEKELSEYLNNINVFLKQNQEIFMNLKNTLYNKKTKMRRK